MNKNTLNQTNLDSIEEINLANSNWWQPKIEKKQLKNLMKRSDTKAWIHTLIYFSSLIISGYIAYLSWGTWWSIPAFIIYGTIYANSNSRWHEYGHRTAFRTRGLNEFFYEISSFLAFFEPVSWRWSHANHHSKTRHIDLDLEIADPRPVKLWPIFFTEFFGYYRIKAELIKIIKHSFRNFKISTDQIGNKPPLSVIDLIPKSQINRMVWTSRAFLLIILSTIAYSFYIRSVIPLFFVVTPQIYGGPILWILAFPQHAGLKFNSSDHRETTRTLYLGPILGYFLYSNMQYHIEHHVFPQVPFYNLPKLHELIKSQLPKSNRGLIDAYWEIIPAILKQSKDSSYNIEKELPS
jgi:fatty acid desaturase